MAHTKRVVKFFVYALLLCSGCHMLRTGSPIPLWHLESLNSPLAVQEITNQFLLLENGQKVTLPMIQRIAASQPLFRMATEQGVEIQNDGEVVGLVWLERNCGNDPCVWSRVRINLSDLSGALEPDGIDPDKLSIETIQDLKMRAELLIGDRQHSPRKGKTTIWDRMLMRHVRRAFNAANGIKDSE